MPRDGGTVTMRDVAKRAGVSHQTVSRYLRFGGSGVRESYRERIRAAVAELGYRPNIAARAMRTRRTGRLAVLLPEGAAHSSVEVLDGAAETARAAGFGLDVVSLGGDPEDRSLRAMELIGSGLFEGVLALTHLGLPEESGGSWPRTVEFPLYDAELHGIGLLADGAPVGELVERLAAAGHRRFLHVAGSWSHESALRRRDAYRDAISRLGLADHGIVESGWSPEAARQAILALPEDSGVTAVVAANDTHALAVIRGALERGWHVPGDLSVTGFDTSELAAWVTPSLTSVQIDHPELGRRAVGTLLAALHDEPAPAAGEPVMRVVWRESTGPTP